MADSSAPDEIFWESVYQENFELIEEGELPDDFFVLDGNFYVTTKDERKCLALAPHPVNEHGFLFGPRISVEAMKISFACLGGAKSRRYNVFEGALGGIRGLKLRLNPVTQEALIFYQEERQKSIPMIWDSREWMRVIFSTEWNLDKKQTNLKIKIYKESDPVDSVMVQDLFMEEKVPSGKCAFWGFSYAEVEMYWDDLQILVRK